MTSAEQPEQTASRIVREVRAVAKLLTFEQRAQLLRDIADGIYDAGRSPSGSKSRTTPGA